MAPQISADAASAFRSLLAIPSSLTSVPACSAKIQGQLLEQAEVGAWCAIESSVRRHLEDLVSN